ncbi:glycerophosphodiester phosphodiesterase family protein [Winogradskyella sp. A3E31]|uniref:glycerophosphodiester phosphodiesterase family protein n=1 Tax=Winogradskyella sp. A3E31 TaxID=3349637 RepID=UPI00398A8193
MGCQPNKGLDIQGHRGFRGLYPENSLIGFEKAIDLGVTTLELDIAITKDNEVIVTHEPFISRKICLNPKGEIIDEKFDMQYNLYKMTHNEIKLFDCGSKVHPDFSEQEKIKVYKPLLSEVFDLIKQKESDVRLNIELKSDPSYYGYFTPKPKDYVTIVLNTIEENGFLDKVNLQSFDINILEEIHSQHPSMKIALLIDGNESIEEKRDQLSFKPEIISPYFLLLHKELVVSLQEEGYKVIPWTVNTESELKGMLNFRVDGIITDYPNRLFTILNED